MSVVMKARTSKWARFAPGRRSVGNCLLRELDCPALCQSTRFAGGRRADLHRLAGDGASAGDHARYVFGISRLRRAARLLGRDTVRQSGATGWQIGAALAGEFRAQRR